MLQIAFLFHFAAHGRVPVVLYGVISSGGERMMIRHTYTHRVNKEHKQLQISNKAKISYHPAPSVKNTGVYWFRLKLLEL